MDLNKQSAELCKDKEAVGSESNQSTLKNVKVSAANYCLVCGIHTESFCRSCCKAYYCSKNHQKADWKIHKQQCFPVKAVQDGESGRKLLATRNIKQGEIILSETPILITPNTRDQNGLTCLGCCRKLSPEKAIPCIKCGWDLCSEKCEMIYCHARNECPVFVENKIVPKRQDNSYQRYCEIGVLRILLMRNGEPKIWDKLMALNNFREARQNIPETIFNIQEVFHFVREDCKLSEFSEEVVDIAFGIFRGNAFDSSDYTDFIRCFTPDMRYASLLFPTALIPGPSCIPNGHYAIKGRENGNFLITFIAAVDITVNEAISIPYEDTFSGTFIRQEIKKKVFFQNCRCKLCIDSTELTTNISSTKCCECRRGYFIQVNPLEKGSDWKCTNCNSKQVYSQIMDTLQIARTKLYSCMNYSSLDSSIKAVEEIKKVILHPNHFLILQTEIEICRRILTMIGTNEIDNIKSNLTSYINNLIEISRHILSVANIIRPGYNRTRGLLLYCLQFGLLINLTSTSGIKGIEGCSCPINGAEGVKRFRKSKIQELTIVQTEAQRILELEPEDSSEIRCMLKMLQGELKLATNVLI